jgi:hypothetical protein
MSIVRFAPLLLLALPAAVSAQSMNAELFYQKAVALQAKGPLALFSGDLKLMMNEGKASALKARATRLAAIKAGQKPRYCPPEGTKGMSSDEYMDGLAAIPPAERARIDTTEATTRILVRKFPCARD